MEEEEEEEEEEATVGGRDLVLVSLDLVLVAARMVYLLLGNDEKVASVVQTFVAECRDQLGAHWHCE